MADSGAASGGEPAPLETLSRADVGEAVTAGLSTQPVRTLMQALAELGCPVGRSFFHVMRCDAAVGGGFAPDHGVILCHNRLHTRREVLNAMAHELIHAYDHCRFRASGGLGLPLPPQQQQGLQQQQQQQQQQPIGAAGSGVAAAPAVAAALGGSTGTSTSSTTAGGACGAGVDACQDRNFAWSKCRDGPGLGYTAASRAVAASSGAGSSGSSTRSSSSSSSSSSGTSGCFSIEGGLDWTNCRNHACTEIRAANLSGDCSLWQELLRGNLPLLPTQWGPQQTACVARRAALSVALNPGGCGGREGAAAVVAEVMHTCLADTAPFEQGEGVARP